jgi:cytochrome P450
MATSRRAPLRVGLWRALFSLGRDPLGALEGIGRRAGGAVVRLNLGAVRPFLFTHPDHVQRVLRERPEQYAREGMLWKPLRRLEGYGIAGEGPRWQDSRRLLQPSFTARSVDGLLGTMAGAIEDAVGGFEPGGTLDLTEAMVRIVHRSLIRTFFGDRITPAEAARLGGAISTAFASLGWRIMLPFAPDWVRLPGDGAFRRAVRSIDDVIYPHVRRARDHPGGPDLVSLLAAQPDERRVRDDIVAMFVAGTETTALALTWLWLLVDAHPEVAKALQEEVDGGDPGLPYTRLVLQETLRLYPVGWLIPRTVTEPDVVGGVPIPAGATVLLSPYVTHRLPDLWERPGEFEPQRFAPGERRHRFAYFPFGGGVHQCLGSHFFMVEAQLIVAALLRRFRLKLAAPGPIVARAAATLRPKRPVPVLLRPR